VNDAELKLVDPVLYFKTLLGRMTDLELELKQMLLQLNPMLRENKLTDGQLSDVGFFLREVEDKMNELRKDAAARRSLIGEILCMKLTKAFLADSSTELRAEGEYSTGYPDTTTHFRLPKKGSKEYGELMRSLGLKEAAIKVGVVKADFNGLAEYAQEMGVKEIPSTINRFTRYVTIFRRKGAKKGRADQDDE
jgi:hypothetical protein